MIRTSRLVSLLDMYELDAGLFVEIARISGHLAGMAAGNPSIESGPPPSFTLEYGETTPEALIDLYQKIEDDCVKLGLPNAAKSAGRIKDLFKLKGIQYKVMREKYEEFQGRLRDELNSTFCLAIEGRYVAYYNTPHRFGAEVAKRFPAATDDIEEAGKCLALSRPTASVFHLMRTLEIGLQAFADKLSISLGKERNWQDILNAVNGAVKRLPASTREEKDSLGKCSAAALFLQQVKDAWRNDVMHPRAVYTEEQAQEIDRLAKSLMARLAEFV